MAEAAPKNTVAVLACHYEKGIVIWSNGAYHCRYAVASRETYCVNSLIAYGQAYPTEARFYCRLVHLSTNAFN